MNRIFISLLMVAFIIGCATEESQVEAPEIKVDEEGMPVACDLIVDSFLLTQFTGAEFVEKSGGKLENKSGQKCLVQLMKNDGQKVGQIVMTVRNRDQGVNRKQAASIAKKTIYLEDMEFPASWRSISNLHTMVFDHGEHTVSLNMGAFAGMSEQSLLDKAKEISRHIVYNLTANNM